jgi:hypothetical protein
MQVHSEFNERDLGHGASETVLHPLVVVALLVAMVLMLWRPRKFAVIPLFLCAFLVPREQQVLLLGAHFYIRFILVLTGFVRVVQSGFRIAGGFNIIDKLFLVWVSYRFFAATITNWPTGTMEQLQFLLQAICGYFLLRYLIQNEEDVARAAKTLALCAFILGVCMLYEKHSQINPFGMYLGGAPITPEIRNGSARAQATFGHSILAGCFGGTLVPLFMWLWSKKAKAASVFGLAGSTLMVLTANSSTPLLAYVAGILGLLLWPVRNTMKYLRWALVATIAALAIQMNAPVWFVIAHVDVVGGSGGYDRAVLIDSCIRHISEWWLIGTNQNGGWGYDMWDMSNQFVAEAETGGLIALICFIAMIVKCFSRLGTMRKTAKPEQQWLMWCLGSVMLSHLFAYLGVAYWDQTQIWWFGFLAMISAVTIPAAPQALTKADPPASKASKLAVLQEAGPQVSTTVKSPDIQPTLRPWSGLKL